MNEYKKVLKDFLLGCLVGAIILFYTVWLPQILKNKRQDEKRNQNTESNIKMFP